MYPCAIRAALFTSLIALLLIGCQDKPPTPDRPGEEKGEADSGATTNATPDQTSVGEPDARLAGEKAPANAAVDPSPNLLELPADPSVAVLTYDSDNGGEGDRGFARSGPKMVIHADGRVVIHDPFGPQVIDKPDPDHVPSIEAQLSLERVQELVALAAIPAVLDTDFSVLSKEMIQAHGKWADAPITSVSIRTAHIDYVAHVYGLDHYAPKTDSVPWLDIAKVDAELSRVREELIAAHEK